MARPEKPITEECPAADLARELRAARVRAGNPTYKELEEKARCSASVLALAASGERCPTWSVTRSYLLACGADPGALEPLWKEADKRARADRQAARRRPQPKLATVRRLPRRPAGNRPLSADPRLARGPDPWEARTPAEYVYQLRALRAWGGNPGVKQVHTANGRSYSGAGARFMTRSTRKGQACPAADRLGSRATCGADVGEWESAWRALSLREFEKTNPSPILSDQQVSPAEPDEVGTVRPLKRPAQ